MESDYTQDEVQVHHFEAVEVHSDSFMLLFIRSSVWSYNDPSSAAMPGSFFPFRVQSLGKESDRIFAMKMQVQL